MRYKFETNDEDEAKALMSAKDMKIALWDIQQELFRPARKHGYPDSTMQKILDTAEKEGYTFRNKEYNEDYNIVSEAVGRLEDMFLEILEKYNIGID